MQHEGKDVSAWHDIPLQNEDGSFNFVCEIPKETSAKMEVATVSLHLFPIISDACIVRKTDCRSYACYSAQEVTNRNCHLEHSMSTRPVLELNPSCAQMWHLMHASELCSSRLAGRAVGTRGLPNSIVIANTCIACRKRSQTR